MISDYKVVYNCFLSYCILGIENTEGIDGMFDKCWVHLVNYFAKSTKNYKKLFPLINYHKLID